MWFSTDVRKEADGGLLLTRGGHSGLIEPSITDVEYSILTCIQVKARNSEDRILIH